MRHLRAIPKPIALPRVRLCSTEKRSGGQTIIARVKPQSLRGKVFHTDTLDDGRYTRMRRQTNKQTDIQTYKIPLRRGLKMEALANSTRPVSLLASLRETVVMKFSELTD